MDDLGPGTLPHEPGSNSELLAATHLFVVRVSGAAATPWERGADGLEHQTLRLDLRLGRVLKGRVARALGANFTVVAPREREDAATVSDYHGFWSHAEVEAGEERLVIAEGTGDDPATLMLEPAIRKMADAALVADVIAAQGLEQRYAAALAAGGGEASRAAEAALAQVDHGRAQCQGPLGRYLWARLSPVYAADEAAIRERVLTVALAKDTTPELRAAMVEGLFTATLDLAPEPERRIAVAGPLFRLLELPPGAISRDRLVQAVLFGLVFGTDHEPISATATVPDARERASVIAALSGMSGDRPMALAHWLGRP